MDLPELCRALEAGPLGSSPGTFLSSSSTFCGNGNVVKLDFECFTQFVKLLKMIKLFIEISWFIIGKLSGAVASDHFAWVS